MSSERYPLRQVILDDLTFIYLFLSFLGLHPRNMEVSRLGV